MRILLATALLLVPVTATAQAADEGVFIIRKGGEEIGREEFSIRPDSPRPGRTTIVARSQYVGARAPLQLTATLELDSLNHLISFRLSHDSGAGPSRYSADAGPRVLIIHQVSRGSERAREMPGGPEILTIDEGVYALLTALTARATEQGKQVPLIYPRTGERGTVTVRRESTGSGVVARLSGDLRGSIRLDDRGRMVSMEFPASGIEILRLRP